MIDWTTVLVIGAICGAIAVAIGQRKNIGTGESFAWGFLLGVIGVIVIICMKPRLPQAPTGFLACRCTRCGAVQNVRAGLGDEFECWQCKTTQSVAEAYR